MKTGRNQGVRLDFPHSRAIVRQLAHGRDPKEKLFKVTPESFYRWWKWGCAQVGLRRPPHSCRHTGASRDAATGYRSLRQIQRRGRWLVERSVQRYAKSHEWIAALAKCPKDIREEGDQILAARGDRAPKPEE